MVHLPLLLALTVPSQANSTAVLAPSTFPVTVREAVAARKVSDSELKGATQGRTPFREIQRDGGVLVGLEVGLARGEQTDYVRCFRPVYRLGTRDWTGPPVGDFVADEVIRTVRAVARDGYVIGGVWLNATNRIDGLSLVFHRLKELRLDPEDKYQSEWIGNGKADQVELLGGKGQPIVGLFGKTHGQMIVGLGVTFVSLALPTPTVLNPPSATEVAPPRTTALESEAPARHAMPDSSSGWGWAIVVGFLGILVVSIPVVVVMIRKRRQKAHRTPVPLPALRPLLARETVQLRVQFEPPAEVTNSTLARDLWLPPSRPAPPAAGTGTSHQRPH